MRLGGFVFAVLLGGCTLDFDGVGPGADGAGGSGATAPTAGKGQGGDDQPLNGGGDVGGSNSAGANVGGAASCDADNGECVEQPVGFSGLIELREGIACAGIPVLSGGLEGGPITALPATCGCACEFNDEVCGDIDVYVGTNCDGLDVSVLADPSGCTALPQIATQSPHSVLVELGNQPGAGCKSNGDPSTKAPISFDEPVNACTIDATLSCGDTEVCLPSDGGTYCLVAEGATICPVGEFSNAKRLVGPSDFTDDRICTCGCGSTMGQVSCTLSGVPQLFEGGSCMGSSSTLIQFAGCFTSDEPGSLAFVPTINGACTPANPNPTGTVDPIFGAGQLLCCNTP